VEFQRVICHADAVWLLREIRERRGACSPAEMTSGGEARLSEINKIQTDDHAFDVNIFDEPLLRAIMLFKASRLI
jgi:hypothetical protein